MRFNCNKIDRGPNPLSGVDPTGYQTECVTQTGSHVCGAETIGPLSGAIKQSGPAAGAVHLGVNEKNGSRTDLGTFSLKAPLTDVKGAADIGRSSGADAKGGGELGGSRKRYPSPRQ